MKIHHTQKNPAINHIKREKEKMEVKTQQSPSGVKVEISQNAKDIYKAMHAGEKNGYSKRVESIRQSVVEGTYKPDPKAIVKKLMQTINQEKGRK
jgi:flagellar biosynthesis anti-sigma factor FlgM